MTKSAVDQSVISSRANDYAGDSRSADGRAIVLSHSAALWKVLAFWGAFLLLHYAYDFFPNTVTSLFSGIDESLFQHLKIGFFAYFFVSAAEYLVYRARLTHPGSFVYARLLTTTLVPWYIFLLWYTAAAYYGKLPTTALEIIYANFIVVVVAMCGIVTERQHDRLHFDRPFRVIIIGLFLVSISLFLIFTFQMPWADVFADPT